MSDNILRPSMPISLAEASVVSNLPHELLSLWLHEHGDELTLREALYGAVLAQLCMLRKTDAMSIAHVAATEAQADGTRSLCIVWVEGEMAYTWWNHQATSIHPTRFVIEVETLFTTLAARLVAHRSAIMRPN